MHISPDGVIFWQNGIFKINATMVFTWALMFILVFGSWMVTRKLVVEGKRSRWQNVLEMIVSAMVNQISELGLNQPRRFLPYLGTIFLYLFTANLFTIIPGYEPPTSSLSTTAGLALSVFVAVPLYGIQSQGIRGYIKSFLEPTLIMLPFNIMSELTRTLALAVRLFGNMMSGVMIVAILLTVTPFLFPIVMTLLGLLTGTVQAFIFSILAGVFIAAAMGSHEQGVQTNAKEAVKNKKEKAYG